MNKIDFFNKVLEIHDEDNQSYNEHIADILLSTNSGEFNVFYELFNKINNMDETAYPYIVQLDRLSNGEDKIKKFTVKVKKDTLEDVYSKLKEINEYNSAYNSAICKFGKNSKNNIIFIEISIKKQRFCIFDK